MPTECAVERHKSVADQLIAYRPCAWPERRGDCEAVDPGRQRDDSRGRVRVPAAGPQAILGGYAAVAQIGDSGATCRAEASERRRIPTHMQRCFDPAAELLEQRAVMRRAEKHEAVQRAQPRVLCTARPHGG